MFVKNASCGGIDMSEAPIVGLQTNFPVIMSCAGCGKLLAGDDKPWQAQHFGTAIPAAPINSSDNSASGVVLVWHCRTCDPQETRISFLRSELEKLEGGEYGAGTENSDAWKFVQGL